MKTSLTIAVMEKKETQINFLNSNLQRIPNNVSPSNCKQDLYFLDVDT